MPAAAHDPTRLKPGQPRVRAFAPSRESAVVIPLRSVLRCAGCKSRENAPVPTVIPTLELIRLRARQGSRPGDRNDDCRLALVIEGGGMRGVVSGGMVAALEHLGLRNVFDVVYGSSSGAMAGAYFVASQARFGTTIYYQCLGGRRFIRKLNLLSRRPVMDTSYLIDHVCRDVRPLDTSAILDSDIPLNVIGSSMRHRAPVTISEFSRDEDVFEALRCSITVPGIAGAAVPYNDDFLFDSALYESIPLRTARAAGATHALVLLTRTRGTTREAPGLVSSALLRFALRHQPAEIVEDWLQIHHGYSREMDEIRNADSGACPDIHAQRVQLDGTPGNVSQLETRPAVLESAARDGFDAVFSALGLDGFIATQVLGGSFRSGATAGIA